MKKKLPQNMEKWHQMDKNCVSVENFQDFKKLKIEKKVERNWKNGQKMQKKKLGKSHE